MKKFAFFSILSMISFNAMAINTNDDTEPVSIYSTVAIEHTVEVSNPSEKTMQTLVEVNTHLKEGKTYICLKNNKDRKDFINYLSKIRTKFGEWKSIAEENDVRDFRKGFNITSPLFQICWNENGKWYTSNNQIMNFHFFVSPKGDCYVIAGGVVEDQENNAITKFWNLNFHYDFEFEKLIEGITTSSEMKNKNVASAKTINYTKLFK